MRKLLAGLLTVGIVLLLGYCALRLLFLGRIFPPDYRVLATEGQPIVQAIYEFKQQTGLWPLSLNELTPEYLPATPDQSWMWEYPSLSRPAGMPHTGIVYAFRKPDVGWSANGDFGTGAISLPQPATTRPAPNLEQRFAAAMSILDSRISHDPKDFDRQRDKVRFLVHQGHEAEALALVTAMAKSFPEHWWSPMTVATLSKGQAKADAVLAFSQWADSHPCFNNYWYVAEYFRQNKQPAKALESLDHAADHSVQLSRSIDRYVPDYFCFNAAAYACSMKKYELALKLCQQWDAMAAAQGYGGHDALAIRSAAYLGLGQFDEARSYAAKAIAQDKQQRGWAGNLDKLNAAAQAGDKGFVYNAEVDDCCGSGPLDLFESFGVDE